MQQLSYHKSFSVCRTRWPKITVTVQHEWPTALGTVIRGLEAVDSFVQTQFQCDMAATFALDSPNTLPSILPISWYAPRLYVPPWHTFCKGPWLRKIKPPRIEHIEHRIPVCQSDGRFGVLSHWADIFPEKVFPTYLAEQQFSSCQVHEYQFPDLLNFNEHIITIASVFW